MDISKTKIRIQRTKYYVFVNLQIISKTFLIIQLLIFSYYFWKKKGKNLFSLHKVLLAQETRKKN